MDLRCLKTFITLAKRNNNLWQPCFDNLIFNILRFSHFNFIFKSKKLNIPITYLIKNNIDFKYINHIIKNIYK